MHLHDVCNNSFTLECNEMHKSLATAASNTVNIPYYCLSLRVITNPSTQQAIEWLFRYHFNGPEVSCIIITGNTNAVTH